MKRLAAIMVVAAAMVTTLVACSGSPSTPANPKTDVSVSPTAQAVLSPGDVALLYVDAFRGNPAALRAYNPNSSFSEEYFDTLGESAGRSWGVTFSDEQRDQIALAYKKALATLEANVVKEEVTSDKATVSLAIKGVDFATSLKQQSAELDKSKVTAENKAETYAQLLTAALNRAPLVSEPTTTEMTLTNQGGTWVPEPTSAKALINALVNWG